MFSYWLIAGLVDVKSFFAALCSILKRSFIETLKALVKVGLFSAGFYSGALIER